MASTNGLQNNSLVVATIDGLTTIYATAIYDNGVLLNPGNYVPYSGAVAPVNLGGQELQTSFVPVNGSDVVNLTALQASNTYILGIASTNFVPYTGANSDTTLGTYKMSSSSAPTTGNNFTNKTYVDTQDALRVPYTGATSSLDMGTNNMTAQNVVVGNSTTAGTLSFGAPSGGYQPWKMFTDSSGNLKFRTASGTTPILFSIDNVGNITTSQTVYASTAQFSGITSATPALALGVDGSGNLRSFAVPTATNLLPLNNTWTGTNTFNNNITTAMGTTSDFAEVAYVGENLITSAVPTATGISASAPTPTGAVTFSSPTYTLTPSGASTFASCWSSATFVGTTRCFFNFTNASLPNTPGSATITVCQANTANTAYIAVSSAIAIPQSASTFSGYFAPNTNSSYLGQVFFIFSNIKFNPFSWTAFSYGYGSLVVQGNQTNYGAQYISNGVAPPALGTIGGTGDRLVLWPGSSSAYPFSLGIDNSTLWYGVPNGCQHLWYVNGTTVMTLNPSGQLGIGVSPLNPLHVYNNTPIPSITTSGYMPSQLALQSNSAVLKMGQYYTGGTGAPAYIQSSDYYSSVEHPQPIILNPLGGTVCIGTKVQGANTRPVGNTFARFSINSDYSDSNSGFGINASDNTSDTYTMKLYPYVVASGVVGYAFGTLNSGGNYTPISFNRNFVGFNQVNPSYAVDIYGNQRVLNGDDSMTYYGPNATWNSRLVVGAGTEKSGASTAQVITTNGNLHLDGGNGNAIYYGYYANSHGTPNPHYFYGTDIEFSSGIPQQTDTYSYPVVMCGARLCKSQAMMRQRYQNNGIGWGGGVNITYAFYRYNGYVSVKISGKLSYYVSSGTRAYPYIRIYSQTSGATWTYTFEAFTNNASNHTTFPIELVLYPSDIAYTGGWFDLYVYNAGNCNTDTNDQLWINVELLPGSDF